MMTLEEEKRMKELISKHVEEKANALAAKTDNKYIKWFFRLLATAAAIIGVYSMTGCTMHATPEGFDFAVLSTPTVNATK